MKTKGFRKSIIAVMLIAAFAMCATACNEQISSSDLTSSATQSVDPLSYSYIDNKTREYTFALNEYMREHAAETLQKTKTGATLGGVKAQCTYTLSNDQKYEVLQMEKEIANGVQVDEYFNMEDAVFVTRTTVYDDGGFDPVIKYYITNGSIYKVDVEATTVTKIADLNGANIGEVQANRDIYLSFAEIRQLYA